jgi:hypothetical protein
MKTVNLIKYNDGNLDGYAVQIVSGYILKTKKYVDLKSIAYRWDVNSQHFKDCIGPKELAEEVYNTFAQRNIKSETKIEIVQSKVIKK